MADPTVAVDPTSLLHTQPLPLHSPVDLLALVESYRTGILLLDGILVLLVPIVIQQFILVLQNEGDSSVTVFAALLAWLWPAEEDERVERTIEITQRYNRDGYKIWDYEQKNHLLQKAISQYLSDILDLNNKDAKYELLEKPHENGADGDSDDEDDDEDGDSTSEIESLRVRPLPLTNTWIEVEKGLMFRHEIVTPENPGDNKGVTDTKIIYRLSSKSTDGSSQIEDFIARAFAKYQENERRKVKEDKSRYFYIQSGMKASSTDANQQVVAYKRYALGEEKTFDNLFFDEKQQVLQLLDNFANKTGKFAIKGFPYKLGFLLHGPPGTGKTSLIKAIAQYTKRHIVTINLGKIKSNQELMDAVFDLKFAVDGLDSPVEYTFKDVIFVMEDIDCASSIVNKRGGDAEETQRTDEPLSELGGSAKKLVRAASTTDDKKNGDEKKTDEEKLMSMVIKMVLDDEKKNSKLNLAGLLNVLDGVIDCPGRIIVMTTNHPEKLDPALIRPGRVNKNLLLSYMNAKQVCQMIEYYTMTTLSEDLIERIKRVFEKDSKLVSPAEVEEMCAEFDSTEKIVQGLEKVAFASRF